MISKWIVELGELDATFKQSDISQLKAFITQDSDTIRRPYARKESTYARRTVLFGSVNPKDYLKDPTGNRRFWTVRCTDIDYDYRVDMQQVWAEFKALFDKGETWYLNQDEIVALNAHNEDFSTVDPVEERIRHLF